MYNPNRAGAAGHHYRADIDGLRAVAVVPVVLHHFQVPGFAGGFVGVDVFFVISGFLITKLIYPEICEGRFTFTGFYRRRMRRIFPALFFLMVVLVPLVALIMFPADFQRFGRSMVATVFFASNILFYTQAGYFDVAGSLKPLLHTWSLAVEEQFYLGFPPLLYILQKLRRPVFLTSIAVIAACSFAASAVGTLNAPSSAFYLLPSRMWELLIGALLALGVAPQSCSPLLRNFVGAAGLVLISIAIFCYSPMTKFPGFAALLPCVGASLVIYSGADGQPLVKRVLSRPVLVFFGLISYSLYLWHWPLYVLGGYLTVDGMNAESKVVLIGLSVLLAWLSFRFVELPFRRRQGILADRRVISMAAANIVVLATVGFVINVANGFPQRFSAQVLTLLQHSRENQPAVPLCYAQSLEQITTGRLCRIGAAHARPNVLLWGDSHAYYAIPGIAKAAADSKSAVLIATHAGCVPLKGVDRLGTGYPSCLEFSNTVLQFLQRRQDISTVILMGRWWRSALGSDEANPGAEAAWLKDDQSTEVSLGENLRVFTRGMDRTFAELTRMRKRVVVVGPVPEARWPVPETMAKLALFHRQVDLGTPEWYFRRRQRVVTALIDSAQQKYHFALVTPADVLCTAGTCVVAHDGQPFFSDSHHLSPAGAMELAPVFGTVFHQGDCGGCRSGDR